MDPQQTRDLSRVVSQLRPCATVLAFHGYTALADRVGSVLDDLHSVLDNAPTPSPKRPIDHLTVHGHHIDGHTITDEITHDVGWGTLTLTFVDVEDLHVDYR